ncbi:MAG: hypothetical protein EWM47_02090 [Anaerolineaceae bacterium]|nr:MAG: hypothetical protein EWM47_02090 [Anaerolineaceae bacterium]
MKRFIKHKSQEASITVFLSLVLLLILSLVMTVIEGARQTTAMIFAERALTTSMDSILAGFYGPLMEEYHLLGLDSSYDDVYCDYDEISERMQDYISYTLNPANGINGAINRINLYSNSLESVELLNSTSLVDHQGQVFIHEVTEYMKYRSVGDLVEYFLDKASLLEQPKKVSVLYEEKVRLEEELVAIDEGILALMKYIDGVSTGRKGILKEKGGKLKTEPCFTKKILYGIPTMESTGINNEAVFLALEEQYIDPSEAFKDISNSFERLDEAIRSKELLETNLEMVQGKLEDEKSALEELEETLANSKDADNTYKETIETNIHEAEDKISEFENEEDSIRETIDANRREQMNCINTITSKGNDIYDLTFGSLVASEQAISELERIIITANEQEPLIKSYESNLNKEKEVLDTEIYNSLEEGLNELKRYQIDNSKGYDFIRMKEILIQDYNILVSCMDSLNNGNAFILSEDYRGAREAYKGASQKLSTYDTEGLNINYSTLVLEKEDSPDYLDGMKDLIKAGITSLVIDPKTISEKEISSELLPSIIDMLSEDEEGFSFSRLLKNMKIGGKKTGTEDLFASFGDSSLGSLIGNAADEILERILVQGYIKDHFYKFPVNEDEREGRKPSVLDYEMEYLLYGKASDKGNLEAVIGRLILIRTLLNFTTILGDKAKWKEAKSIATTLVGFTGLPILVAITQGVLMILLALGSSLVDTCALLIGKDIPIIKKKIELKFSDLLLLTRENIRKKAAAYKEDAGFSYNDYMTLFLCLTNQRKLSYRMMDLMQENINMRYGSNIKLQNIIFGYEVEAKFKTKPLFTTISFIQKYNGADINKPLIVRAECSY